MKKKLLRPRVFLALLVLLISLSAYFALAGANTVPATNIDDYSGLPPTPDDLKPAECNPIYVDEITAGGGVIIGTRSNNLILGSSGMDIIFASNAGQNTLTNCITGGAGDDFLFGSKKDEIFLGGPGDDYIDGGKGYDICYGGGGNDTFINCEEIY